MKKLMNIVSFPSTKFEQLRNFSHRSMAQMKWDRRKLQWYSCWRKVDGGHVVTEKHFLAQKFGLNEDCTYDQLEIENQRQSIKRNLNRKPKAFYSIVGTMDYLRSWRTNAWVRLVCTADLLLPCIRTKLLNLKGSESPSVISSLTKLFTEQGAQCKDPIKQEEDLLLLGSTEQRENALQSDQFALSNAEACESTLSTAACSYITTSLPRPHKFSQNHSKVSFTTMTERCSDEDQYITEQSLKQVISQYKEEVSKEPKRVFERHMGFFCVHEFSDPSNFTTIRNLLTYTRTDEVLDLQSADRVERAPVCLTLTGSKVLAETIAQHHFILTQRQLINDACKIFVQDFCNSAKGRVFIYWHCSQVTELRCAILPVHKHGVHETNC